MKKIASIALIASLMLIAGCGSQPKENPSSTTSEKSTTQNETVSKTRKDESGKVEHSEVGTKTIIAQKKGLEMKAVSGPFEIELTDAQIATLDTNATSKPMFDGKDKVTILTLHFKAENKSSDTNAIYLDQGTVTTNTKEQKNASLLLSDQVGGDFIGNVVKEGFIIFALDSDAKEIKTIKYFAQGPHDNSLTNIGDDISFEIDFSK